MKNCTSSSSLIPRRRDVSISALNTTTNLCSGWYPTRYILQTPLYRIQSLVLFLIILVQIVLTLPATVTAQQTLTTNLRGRQITQDGVVINLSPTIVISLPNRSGTLFGNQTIVIEVLDFNEYVAFVEVDGSNYYRSSFNGALRSLFNAIEVSSSSMWITLNDVEDCVRHSYAAWSVNDKVSRFCEVTTENVPTVRSWDVSGVSLYGVRELVNEIRNRNAEIEAERNAQAVLVHQNPTRVENQSQGTSQEWQGVSQQQQSINQARAQHWASQCQRADVAWRDGRRQEAARIYREALNENASFISPQCLGEARSRVSDQNVTEFAYGTTSVLSAISQAWDIMAGISIGYYPDGDNDTSSGMAYGFTFGKSIFFFDAQLGDRTIGPVFAATQEPNIPGCSGPFGTNGWGTSCSELYDNWYSSTGSIRWRVNYAVGGGIVSPVGLNIMPRSYLFPAINVMYVDTERGAEIVPGIGLILGSKTWGSGRRRVFSGEGVRVLFTEFRGETGIQVAGQFTF